MLVSIQFLRAFASILVLFHHISYKDQIYGNDVLSFFTIGEIGVDIFFIISGYIMMHSTHQKPVKAGDFIVNRIIRIIPLYWTFTIIALIIYIVMPDKINSSGGATVVFESFVLFPTEGKYLVQNGWTLRYEFLFYFIFMISLFLKNKRFIAVTIFGLFLVGIWLNPSNLYLSFVTNDLLLEFLFGIFLYLMRYRYSNDNIGISILVFFTSISFLYYFKQNPEATEIRAIYYGIPALLFSASFLLLEQKLKNFESVILLFGNSSYSLYLVHPFVLVACALIFKRFASSTVTFDIGFIFVMFLASIIAGMATYKYVEVKQIRLIKNLKR